MAIQLIQDDEQLEYHSGGSIIYYRRLPANVRARFVKRATKKGVTNMEKVASLGLEYCVIGWDNVQAEGKSVPFEPALLAVLPEEDREGIAELAFIGGLDEPTGEVDGDDSPLDD